jgi:hypothetical protein
MAHFLLTVEFDHSAANFMDVNAAIRQAHSCLSSRLYADLPQGRAGQACECGAPVD